MSVRTWGDVQPGDWYYQEVMEASNYPLEDGSPLVQGSPYDVYEAGKPRLYLETIASRGQVEFEVGQVLTPGGNNPLLVYVDGIQTLYKQVNVSQVTLYYPPRAGAQVSFLMPGVPQVDANGRPMTSGGGSYPSQKLDHGDRYAWNPLDGRHLESCYAFGRQLRRASIPAEAWSRIGSDYSLEELLRTYIGLQHDVYAICPPEAHSVWGGWLFMPYNLNGVSCQVNYWSREADGSMVQRGGACTAHSEEPWQVDRFFPEAAMTRAEAYGLIARLRTSFYRRFTDLEPPQASFAEVQTAYEGQRVYKLHHRYATGAGELLVQEIHPTTGDGVATLQPGRDYTEFDDHTVLLARPATRGKTYRFQATHRSQFPDLSPDEESYQPIVSLELESLSDGTPLVVGRPGGLFQPEEMVTRAEAVTLLHSFLQWCIERFSL